MTTKKMNYVHPTVRIISLENEGDILNSSVGGNEDFQKPDVSGVGASSWADGNDDWFATNKYEGGIWK